MPVKTARSKSVVKLKRKKKSGKNRLKRVFTVLLLTFSSLVILGGYSLLKIINHNLASAFSPTENQFNENGYPTLLYITVKDLSVSAPQIEKIEFKIFDLDGEHVFSYDIPLDYEVDMPGRLGMEKISNIFLVSDLNNTGSGDVAELDNGINALNKSLLTIFGIKAERYIVADKETSQKTDEFLQKGDYISLIDKNYLFSLPKHLKSNFSTKEILDIASFIRSLPADRIIKNPYINSYINNTEVIDQEIRDLMLLSPLSKESFSIAILNGAGKSGFAAFGARVVANNGGRVVAVNNSDQDIKSSVIISNELDSLTVRKLAWLFGINNVLTKEQAENQFRDTEIDRADIVIVLGFDLAESL